MKIGSIVAEDDGWWCQVVGERGRMWTIRIRLVSAARLDVYECWVNDVLLPAIWRRETSTGAGFPTDILALALGCIAGFDQTL